MTSIEQVIHPQVHTHGEVTADASEYALRKLRAALHHTSAPVLRALLTLDAAAPGNRVDAHVDINGVRVHVHAVGDTMQEAIDAVQDRLRSRLRRIRRRPAQGPRAPEPDADPIALADEFPASSGTTTTQDR